MTTIKSHFNSTKYTLAGMFTMATIIGLFTDKLDGGTFVAAATLILSVYAAADVSNNIFGKRSEEKHDV